jgi:hypothetical protein
MESSLFVVGIELFLSLAWGLSQLLTFTLTQSRRTAQRRREEMEDGKWIIENGKETLFRVR